MLKYLVFLAMFLGSAFVIARHDEVATLKGAYEAADKGNSAVTGKPNEAHPQEHVEDTGWDSPSGHIFHNAFRWPEGTTVWAIILTLLAIAEQTSQTRKAAEATQASTDIARRQADLLSIQNKMMKDKDRANLAVRYIEPPELLPKSQMLPNDVPVLIRMFIANEGNSKAFDVQAFGVLNVVESLDAKYHPGKFALEIPRTIRDTDTLGFVKVTIVPLDMGPYFMADERLIEKIKDGERFLQISGVVTYDDTFGDPHEMPFNFVWKGFSGDLANLPPSSSYWMDLSPAPEKQSDQKSEQQAK